MSSLPSASRLWAFFLCSATPALALVHHAAGNSHTQQALGTEIAGWTKVLSCADSDATDRLLFPAEEVQGMAALATRVKYCLYGSTTNCVTSMANTFPIVQVRQGGATSHDDGAPCGGSCVSSIWEDDDPSTGIAVPDDLWASCGSAASGLSGDSMLHQSGCNSPGLHLSVNDGGSCCWYSGTCTQGGSEAGVEMYLDLIPGWTKVLSCADSDATDRLLFPAAEIQSLATGATQVKYCLYGSTTDCVTSIENTFPIVEVRQGGPTSHDADSPCDGSCVSSVWEDDDPSTGITVPDDLWATCSSGTTLLHHSGCNTGGLHLDMNDGGSCCWYSGTCTQGASEAGVEMYLNVLTASPTVAPTYSPTSPPTSSPTKSPTFSPTHTPTASPTTAEPTFSPTSSPTTASPTSAPTASPTTASPTSSPTSSPTTASPTSSPTTSPTTASPTTSPTSSPTTASPTSSPTTSSPTASPAAPSPPPPPPASSASATGDPHIQNIRGERFDLFRQGRVTLLLVPLGATHSRAIKLRVDGHAKAVGDACAGHYIDSLNITGAWAVAKAAAAKGTGDGKSLTVTARMKYASPIHPRHTQALTFGPGIRLVLVNGVTDSGVTYLNIRFQNLDKAGVPIGGLLGEDDYDWATQRDPQCSRAAASLMAMDSKIMKVAAGKREGPQITAYYGTV